VLLRVTPERGNDPIILGSTRIRTRAFRWSRMIDPRNGSRSLDSSLRNFIRFDGRCGSCGKYRDESWRKERSRVEAATGTMRWKEMRFQYCQLLYHDESDFVFELFIEILSHAWHLYARASLFRYRAKTLSTISDPWSHSSRPRSCFESLANPPRAVGDRSIDRERFRDSSESSRISPSGFSNILHFRINLSITSDTRKKDTKNTLEYGFTKLYYTTTELRILVNSLGISDIAARRVKTHR